MDDRPHAGVGIRITSDPDETRVERPATKATDRRASIPYRIVLVSDLAPGYQGGPFIRVDPHAFGDLMRSLAPRLRLDVRNHITSEPARLELDLSFGDLRDFEPERLAKNIPALAALYTVRTGAAQLRDGKTDADGFRRMMQEGGVDPTWTEGLLAALIRPPSTGTRRSGASEKDEDAIDRLLGMVDAPSRDEQPQPRPSGDDSARGGLLGAFVDAVTGGGEPKPERSAVDDIIADLDETIASQVGEVVAHPSFRRLESAWRGLKFVVANLDRRAEIELDVLPAMRDQLSDALYTHVLMPEHDPANERAPISLVVLGFEFDASQRDIEGLTDIAETAASLQAPIVASVSPAFFSVASWRGLEQLPPLRQHLDGPAWIAWHKLRERNEAPFVALALPSILGRERYERTAGKISIDETDDLFIGAAHLVPVAVARSLGATGWPSRIRGPERGVDSLPLRHDARGAAPLAAVLSETRQADFAEAGFLVVGCRLNRDAAFIVQAPSIVRIPRFDDEEAQSEAEVHGSLSSRLFAARIAQHLLVFQREMEEGSTPQDAAERMRRRLLAALRADDDAVSVEPSEDQLVVRIQPPHEVTEDPVRLVVGVPLGPHT